MYIHILYIFLKLNINIKIITINIYNLEKTKYHIG